MAAYGDDGDDLLLALARQIVSGEAAADAEPVEAVFAQAQAAAADAEALLVDESWQPVVAPEPAVVAAPANGVHGTGQHPNNHATTPVEGQDRDGAAAAPLPEPLSWAEFLAQVLAQDAERHDTGRPSLHMWRPLRLAHVCEFLRSNRTTWGSPRLTPMCEGRPRGDQSRPPPREKRPARGPVIPSQVGREWGVGPPLHRKTYPCQGPSRAAPPAGSGRPRGCQHATELHGLADPWLLAGGAVVSADCEVWAQPSASRHRIQVGAPHRAVETTSSISRK